MTVRIHVPLIFERSTPGRRGYRLPELDVPETPIEELIPQEYLRTEPPALPEVSELEVVRHYTQLSRLNHGVDVGFYPLGSCTMKYNPRVHEDLASMPGLSAIHPYQPEETVQGALELIYNLSEHLAAIAGLAKASLQPAAGAHGELAGLMVIKAYHQHRGEGHRNEMLVPDSAHGTNPASCAMVGYKVVEVPSDERGCVDVEALKKLVGPNTAGLMLTNPNTLGLFDENICQIADIVHQAGGLLYYDGANANAIMGIVRPGDTGFDVVHFNLHKTFSTPHGGGGPGAGPIVVSKQLAPFLPGPVVEKDGDKYRLVMPEHSVGRIRSFYGNFLVYAKAYAYILSHGPKGLREVSEAAVLNANYVMNKLKDIFALPYDRICMHEFVLSGSNLKKYGVRTLDLAKRLSDYGFHAPTVYFPLIVEEAIMIEPTETEAKSTLDEFIEVMRQIAQEAKENPEMLTSAPHNTPVKRVNEARAARHPVLRWKRDQ
ncbi:MAG TPA: aminomethyl-transferring glycine dehydrogenase subunit GcvPB [Limnochordia bacterium]|nr:aminomethyl-transferring glycine dehydrogenase subunit GcvPB [Limnochordia bacterium]